MSLTVKGMSSPRLFGSPSGTGLQKYEGMSEPLVKAWVGRTVASASNECMRRCISDIILSTKSDDASEDDQICQGKEREMKENERLGLPRNEQEL